MLIQEILTVAALTLAFLSLTESLSVLQLAWLISDVTFGVVTTHLPLTFKAPCPLWEPEDTNSMLRPLHVHCWDSGGNSNPPLCTSCRWARTRATTVTKNNAARNRTHIVQRTMFATDFHPYTITQGSWKKKGGVWKAFFSLLFPPLWFNRPGWLELIKLITWNVSFTTRYLKTTNRFKTLNILQTLAVLPVTQFRPCQVWHAADNAEVSVTPVYWYPVSL